MLVLKNFQRRLLAAGVGSTNSCGIQKNHVALRSATKLSPIPALSVFAVPFSTDRLLSAAEEIVRVARMDGSVLTNSQLSSDVAALKESLDTRLNKLTQVIESSIQNQNTITQKLQAQEKLRGLEWALQNIDLMDDFDYFEGKIAETCSGKTLIKGILMTFRQNKGHYLPLNGKMDRFDDTTKTQFREKVIKEICYLVGVKPRIELKEEQCTIYYS